MKTILVISRHHPESQEWLVSNEGSKEPVLDPISTENDHLDEYNHPRYRRAQILRELSDRKKDGADSIVFLTPELNVTDLSMYERVHSKRLVQFFTSAWKDWICGSS